MREVRHLNVKLLNHNSGQHMCKCPHEDYRPKFLRLWSNKYLEGVHFSNVLLLNKLESHGISLPSILSLQIISPSAILANIYSTQAELNA